MLIFKYEVRFLPKILWELVWASGHVICRNVHVNKEWAEIQAGKEFKERAEGKAFDTDQQTSWINKSEIQFFFVTIVKFNRPKGKT